MCEEQTSRTDVGMNDNSQVPKTIKHLLREPKVDLQTLNSMNPRVFCEGRKVDPWSLKTLKPLQLKLKGDSQTPSLTRVVKTSQRARRGLDPMSPIPWGGLDPISSILWCVRSSMAQVVTDHARHDPSWHSQLSCMGEGQLNWPMLELANVFK